MAILLIIFGWSLSFLFAGIEAGLLAIDPVRLRSQVKQGRPAALRLNRLLQRPERLLVTVLLVTNMSEIFALLMLTRLLVTDFGTLGFAIAALVALPVYLFILGVLPKSLFRRFPFRALAALAGVLELTSTILAPILWLGEKIGALLLPRKGDDPPRLFAAREELKQLAVQSEREGSLTSTERAMIHNVVDFRNVKVRDVMVPLARTITIAPETSVAETVQLSAARGVDRLPIISEGRAVGLINVFDILFDQNPRTSLRGYTRRILTVTGDEPAYRVIRRLRAARLSFAAVVDARRDLIGVTTGEDLVKRLVQSA